MYSLGGIRLKHHKNTGYTNEGDTVHDSCMGSGWSMQACRNLNRNYIGFEISDEWEEHYNPEYTPESWERFGIVI